MADGGHTLRAVAGEAGGAARFWRDLRAGWRWPAAGLALGLAAALALVHLVTPEYTAGMVVGPTARAGSAAMGARVPAGDREASSVAEHGAGDEALSDFARYLHLLTSVPVAERLMADPALLHRLFADRWDEQAAVWRQPGGLRLLLLALVGREDWLEPDATLVARRLQRLLVVEPLGTGPMRRVWLRHADRSFAVTLVRRVATATDAHLRAEAARRSGAQSEHLRARLAVVTVAEHRRALADLLADQERVSMMIGADLPFAADMVEPPSVGPLPDWPNPLVVVPLAGLAGLAAGAFAFGVRSGLRTDE